MTFDHAPTAIRARRRAVRERQRRAIDRVAQNRGA